MKIGLVAGSLPAMMGGGLLKAFAVNAERLGVATLWAPEHLVLLNKYASKYPYSDDGKMQRAMDAPIFDPFISLACVAAVTSKIRIATGICLVPEHNPIALAKTVATLDFLSGGRVTLGVGIGWLKEEFDALGVPWERRADRTREYIDAMRQLWGDDKVNSYNGEFVRFDDALCYPKPVQGAALPVFFGGESGPALRRVAEYGDGWIGYRLTADEAAAKIRRLEELLKANGRKRSDIEVAASPQSKPMTEDDLKRYRDAGADQVVITTFAPPSNEQELVRKIEQLARDWIDPAAKLS
ncbi:MAG: LLM class F420-dependent oxidoreductase [Candidatus Binataceae bacterium]